MELNGDLRELLRYQVELGIDEAITTKSINRLASPKSFQEKIALQSAPEPRPDIHPTPTEASRPHTLIPPSKPPAISTATQRALELVSQVNTLEELREALGQFEECDYRKTAKNLVFSDGNPEAMIMIVGEAPGREEDVQGKPFVGQSGQLLEKIFSEAGLSRHHQKPHESLYITNSINWRPPGNQTPPPEDIAMFRPFLMRHIELIKPKILVLTGNSSCQAVINQSGITKLRGNWIEHDDYLIMPIVHPAFLLRNFAFKKRTWTDVLRIKQQLGKQA